MAGWGAVFCAVLAVWLAAVPGTAAARSARAAIRAAPSAPGVAAVANASAVADCGVLGLPPRPADAQTGTEFAHRIWVFSAAERQQAALAEIRRGNVPDFLRRLRPVWLHSEAGPPAAVRICVTPDYLAVGSDEDFLRVPLAFPTATQIAGELGFVLPTAKIVDAIYEQSAYHLVPQPLPPGPEMRSAAYSLLHRSRIEAQRAGLPLGALISGHKKDLVLTNRLLARPGRVAIYGWHRPDGHAIQPLSTVHGIRYADYSHGARLVDATAWVDGDRRSLPDLLEDPILAPILTYEGELPASRLMALGRDPGAARASCSSGSPGDSCGGSARP
jgi:hypothetical protein